MSRKFSRINQASKLTVELENYIAWLTGKAERQPGIGTKTPRQPSIALYVTPFNLTIPTSVKIHQSANKVAWEKYEGEIGARTIMTLPAGTESIKLRGYRAPRINVVTGRGSANRSVKSSHITKAKYLNYGGTSVSVPFGKGAADTSEDAAFQAIKAAIPNTLIYLIPEKI